MVELSREEIDTVSGGNPVLLIAAYVTVRYAASRIAVGFATGAIGGLTTGYLEGDS
jgi:hypothetical protein